MQVMQVMQVNQKSAGGAGATSMAAEKKIGEGALANMAKLGLEELRNANIPQPETSSYQAAIEAAASRAKPVEREGMSR
jgi:hypothetical protein